MATELLIDSETGNIRVGDLVLLKPNQEREEVATLVASFLGSVRDLGNGYEWLDLKGLTFGGQPASLSICFHGGRLEQASWSVQLPDAPMEGGWPTQEAIDGEISFVRDTLAKTWQSTRAGRRGGKCGATLILKDSWHPTASAIARSR